MAQRRGAKAAPEIASESKPIPEIQNQENCITVGGRTIEIRPPLVRYFRSREFRVYNILETIPLTEVFALTEAENGLDGDKAVFTFVARLLNDEALAREIYDELSADQLLKMVQIFKRLSGISEIEEKNAKNAGAASAKA